MKLFKHKSFKIWLISSLSLITLGVVANVTCIGFIPRVMDNVFGGETGSGRGDTKYFTCNEGITTKEQAKAQTENVSLKLCEEGFTLLKNENNVLPIKTNKSDKTIVTFPKVSVFGKNSVNLTLTGSGSGGGDSKGSKTIFDSLSEAGYEYNPTLKSFYEDNSKSGSGRPENLSTEAGIQTGFATGETPVSSYTSDVKASFSDYDSLALVVISRIAGESYDCPKTMIKTSGAASDDDHYLELDQNEMDMLQLACENFSKVCLVINSSNPIELGFLDEIGAVNDATMNDYDYASHIQAAIWIGGPGYTGIMALGEILNGNVNPSGSLVDTYTRDFTTAPSYCNFSTTSEQPDYYLKNKESQNAWFTDYEEDIYVGYRYYETRGKSEGEAWYKNNVVYPFGYGLSYTEFEWKITNKDEFASKTIEKDKTYTIEVEVDNVGDYAGKDTVELYVEAPYIEDGIEKSSKVLVAFDKTEKLDAKTGKGKVSLAFTPYDFASYDYDDKNANGSSCYELDKGTYTFYVSKDAHTYEDKFEMVVNEDIIYDKDPSTNKEIKNRFDDADDELQTRLSRKDFTSTWPSKRTDEEREISDASLAKIKSKETNNPLTENSDEIKNANLTYATKKDDSVMQLSKLIKADYDDEKWDEFLSGVTLSTMQDVLKNGAFGTDAVSYIGKPKTIETDGPAGLVNFMGTDEVKGTSTNCTEPVMAASRNASLLKEYGEAIGDEGIIGNTKDQTPYSGWYAPGINIHRSPFAGRIYEYYSEDPLLNGVLAASVNEGASNKGIITYMKHFVANECETHRNEICTWVDEQTLREIYLKPFEIATKRCKGTKGLMSSFNRLGYTWTGGDYRLLNNVLREEWGFKGTVICDFADLSFMDLKQMQYGGGDLYLNNLKADSWVNKNNKVDVYVIKQCFKNYMYTLVNSNAMNGLGEGIVYTTNMATWKMTFIIVDIVVASVIVISGAIICFLSLRKDKIESPSK